MEKISHMPIKDFAYLTGIKRENLRFYDQIGLLCPEKRGANGYRYYSRHQLNTAYLICDLRDLGVGLSEIKEYATHRTPEGMLELFTQQEGHIAAEIEHLQTMRDIMDIRTKMALEALSPKDSNFIIAELSEEPIFLCPPPPIEMEEDEKCNVSFNHAFQCGVNLSSPLGVILASKPDGSTLPLSTLQYYFKTKRTQNAKKAAGTYAIAYGIGDTEDVENLYQELVDYLHLQSLQVTSNLYVEWLLDELSTQDTSQYHMRIQVQVK